MLYTWKLGGGWKDIFRGIRLRLHERVSLTLECKNQSTVIYVSCTWVVSGSAEVIPLWRWFFHDMYKQWFESENTRIYVGPARLKQVMSKKHQMPNFTINVEQGRLVVKTKSQTTFTCVVSLSTFSFGELISRQPQEVIRNWFLGAQKALWGMHLRKTAGEFLRVLEKSIPQNCNRHLPSKCTVLRSYYVVG